MQTTTTTATATHTEHPPIPELSKNPLPLSAYQEGQVRDLYYARVRGRCAEEIKQFADCARNRTISAAWACRTPRQAMNSCMVLHATPEAQDEARDEWFRRRIEKRISEREKVMGDGTVRGNPPRAVVGFTQLGKGSEGR
ncbi:uncharacterized protein H6S33_012119 [Morchella sextelata]|uniref:uncharacterized protein n=1 Tax=Morchella sextelata TaxID=1174677 RepID=UPI001D04A883|nr:uncharacterized protein H6S33_012119 [Morchella sextelata]KAH0610592.1 hypothetical protein H6S33_012119 [Morchella sextelata]